MNDQTAAWNSWKSNVNKIASEDLHDLADKLGLVAGKGQKGKDRLYHSPHRPDQNPSFSIFVLKNGEMGWKDHTSGEQGGDAISLHKHCRDKSFGDTVRELAEMYNIPAFVPNTINQPKREKTQVEYIAERVLGGDKDKARKYLNGRGITDKIIDRCFAHKVLGWNTWTSTDPEKPVGTVGHGGEGVAFVVYDRHDKHQIRGVDVRYETPEHNGGVKTNSQGDKDGCPFVVDWARFRAATTVVVVESAINALSVLSAEIKGWDAIAIRGIATVKSLPTDIFTGKFVVLALDYDKPQSDVLPNGKPNKDAGKRAGPEAMWELYAHISASGVPCIIVDQADWDDGWDLNDIIQAEKPYGLRQRLEKWETCPIPGYLAGDRKYPGRPKMYLPNDDYAIYWRYQVGPDLTKYIEKTEEGDDGSRKTLSVADVAGFRVADLSRVRVQTWEDTVHGSKNGASEILFAVQAQTPQHGRNLKRTVMDDKQFTDPAAWSQLGYIYNKPVFMRLVNILSRTLDQTDRLAVNFVGLCYKAGKMQVNEGKDCYFKDVLRQCPAYGHLQFANGTQQHGRDVIHAFQATFKANAGALSLVWALGAHLKAHLGYWPHMQMEAEKGSGKSTFLRHWAKATQTQVFSTQMLDTAFRIQSLVAYSSQPVAWEEISTLRPEAAAAANQMLQQTYNYAYSVRGGTTPMLYSTPVLLTGEEVDMNSLLGKLTRTTLSFAKQGSEIPENLPVFPMRQWLEWLAKRPAQTVQEHLEVQFKRCLADSRSSEKDANAKRIIKNFAAIRLAWHYLCEFLNIDTNTGYFEHDLITEMNNFLSETEAARQPWVWITEIIFGEIDARRYDYPMAYDTIDGKEVILIRPKHMMDHIHHSSNLKSRWDALPIKTAKVFQKQMTLAGVIVNDDKGKPVERERTVNGKRISHMLALDLDKLATFGLYITRTAVDGGDADGKGSYAFKRDGG